MALLISSPALTADSAPTATPAPVTKKAKKGKSTREKETEGTEAADRFEADNVIKSQYELNGVPLEVDPD
jgi:hypothetical protein